MSWNKPDWYMTPREFADLVVASLEATNHFKSDELAHPEDIVIAFTTQAEAIALGAGAAGRKIYAAKKKNAVMQTGNLRKNALPQDDEIAPYVESQEDFLGYSEWKHKK
jgi:hypothetical protein